ncbi:MAG: DUF3159 domain-containing protein [Pseudonocardia sp.]|nr:DUF3159 domain-containing protein [Pseudonocardia sp.]
MTGPRVYSDDQSRPAAPASDTVPAESTEVIERAKPTESARPERPRQQCVLDQLGGLPGIIYSIVPVLAFVVVNALTSLVPAVVTAIVVALAIVLWQLLRREPLRPAVSGLFAVGVCAFIAYRTGQAKGFFLAGIWYSAVACAAFTISVLVRWPLAGVIWHGINGDSHNWRAQRGLVRAYSLATLLWALMFGGRFVVQQWLYNNDQTGWLAVARIGMGLPLTGLAVLGTIWAVRRARRQRTSAAPAVTD